jgi:hypothetical protein
MATGGTWITLVIDGAEREVPLKPSGLMETERRFGGQAFEEHPVEATMVAAWVSLGKPGGDFDAWCATVDEIVNREAPDPTEATPPPESLPSPPAPV